MKLFIGVTDYDWFKIHAARSNLEEVNFWRPSPDATFKALDPGGPFLFKLHAPRNFIAGGGFYNKFLKLPLSLAWKAFREGNGANSLAEVRQRISKYRRTVISPHQDPTIGCIILLEPFFFPEDNWIDCPGDFSPNIVSGKGYDTATTEGRHLWEQVGERLASQVSRTAEPSPTVIAAVDSARYGSPIGVKPRLGQGAFRVLVTEAYDRRCAITQERTLPVLEAGHIRPYSQDGLHELPNGLLLRSDLHRLFDQGYLTVDPNDRRVVISKRIKEEFENGRDYYRLQGCRIRDPSEPDSIASKENLLYHAQNIFH